MQPPLLRVIMSCSKNQECCDLGQDTRQSWGVASLDWRGARVNGNSASRQHHHSPKDFDAISVRELVDNSHKKATMVDEFNAREEDGNWSDKDIVIACVHLFERYSSFQQNSGFCSRLVGPTASGKSSVSFFFFSWFECHFNKSQVCWTGSRNWRPL